MTERTARLRRESLAARPEVSSERAELITDFYRAHAGKYPVPLMRAMAFRHLCRHKTLYMGEGELIVGERGPAPKLVPTYPELTCHSLEDLRILDSRSKTAYRVPARCFEVYEQIVIPYWRERNLRDRMFGELPQAWKDAYEARQRRPAD